MESHGVTMRSGYRRKKEWHEGQPAVDRALVVRRMAEFAVALGVALGVQFAALPSVCREHAARAVLALVGLRW